MSAKQTTSLAAPERGGARKGGGVSLIFTDIPQR